MDRVGEIKRKNIPFYADKDEFIKFVDRVTSGKYGKYTEFLLVESKSGFDEYRISVSDGKIKISATSGTAGGAALNYYLMKYCKFQFGILGTSGTLPDLPPDTEGEITEQSVFHYRYAFNYCTYGYSYAHNDWSDWERITDYLILAGYNLVLNPIGNECVWLELLQRFGYTREEAKSYISAPCYLPWQWMMNLSATESSYPDYWFAEQQEISRKFNRKLRAFGMSALLPGYSGAVPDDFYKKHPGLDILPQGKWNKHFERPSILLPTSELFFKITEEYYKIQRELLRTEGHHYYSTDPFHEGGKKGDVDLKEYGKTILACMQKFDTDAVWCLQGWLKNPDRKIFSGLRKENVLIMNLQADNRADGGDDFQGYPHIYCVVNNFGGEIAMRGSAQKTYFTAHAMAKDETSACVGIGVIPEGVECDEVLFDIIADVSVRLEPKPICEYLEKYIVSRYGIVNEELVSAFKILFDNVYTIDTFMYNHESGLIANPTPEVNRVCYWAAESPIEDVSHLYDVLTTLLKYYESCKARAGYVTDVVAVARQLLANVSWRYIYPLNKALKEKDKKTFYENKEKLLKLFPLQENIIDCDPSLNLQLFLDRAAKRGKTERDKRWLVSSVKRLITLWGDESCTTLLDYSPREFGDMIRDYYRPRWEKYLNYVTELLESDREYETLDIFEFTESFIAEYKEYPRHYDKDLKKAANDILVALKDELS